MTPSGWLFRILNMSELLDRVRAAAESQEASKRALREAINTAAASHTIREVAAAAGLSPTRVHQIVAEAALKGTS